MVIKVKCYFPIKVLQLATQNLQDSSGNWENKIISISELSRNVGEDKSYEISGISIEFNDTDRYFRDMMSGKNRYIAGATVELRMENDELIYTGTVEKWSFTADGFVLNINDRLSGLDILVPQTMSSDLFGSLPETSIGQSVPLIYGEISAPYGGVRCWKVSTGKFLLAGHLCTELIGSKAYLDDNSFVTAVMSYVGGFSYITCTVADDVDSVRVNVKGKCNAQGVLIDEPVAALRDVLDMPHVPLGYNVASLNAAEVIMRERGYKIAMALDKLQTVKDILATFCVSFDCDFFMGKENDIVLSLLEWSNMVGKKSYNEDLIVDFSVNELPEEIRNKVQYSYKYDYAEEKYQKTPVYANQSSIDDWGEFYNKSESLNLQYVADDVTAYDVMQRFAIQRKNPRRIANVSLPLSEFIGIDIADVIEIEHPQAISAEKRKYHVRRVNIDFSGDFVQVEAADISAFTGGVFVLGDRNETIGDNPKLKLKWSDTDLYSRGYGYLAERDGINKNYFGNKQDYGKVLY